MRALAPVLDSAFGCTAIRDGEWHELKALPITGRASVSVDSDGEQVLVLRAQPPAAAPAKRSEAMTVGSGAGATVTGGGIGADSSIAAADARTTAADASCARRACSSATTRCTTAASAGISNR